MNIDPTLVAACFGIGIVVGLTGMGGGALMTPVLVLFFNIPPLTAVSSDLVAAAVMKPVGGAVHLRRGTVNLGLVKWLCVGSVPAAFGGVLLLRAFGEGKQLQDTVQLALGVALLHRRLGPGRARLPAAARAGAAARWPRRAAPPGPPRGRPAHRADRDPRRRGRPGRRHDLGRFGLAHHHLAHGALPDAQGEPAGRNRPGPGRAAGRLGGPGPHLLRRLPPRPDGVAGHRQRPRGLAGRPPVLPRSRRPDPAGPGVRAARPRRSSCSESRPCRPGSRSGCWRSRPPSPGCSCAGATASRPSPPDAAHDPPSSNKEAGDWHDGSPQRVPARPREADAPGARDLERRDRHCSPWLPAWPRSSPGCPWAWAARTSEWWSSRSLPRQGWPWPPWR